jgi:D-glycero-D-manno-heptose 1,7-bisphosphate phosphatase
MNQALHKCVFLDRDGILNHDPGDYTWRKQDFQLLPGVGETLKHWQNCGFKLIVITNQGGIAKGMYSSEDVEELHNHLKELLSEFGVVLTDIFYSPYHPVAGESISRKPSGLMIQRGLALHDIDPVHDW